MVTVFQHNFTREVNNGFFSAYTQNLYREDLFYADKQFYCWSMKGPDGSEERKKLELEKFSERFYKLYPGYTLDRHMHVVASPQTPVINL